MIRYKEKKFTQYSICPATGDIFDVKTGVVQKTHVHQGRSTFKGMPVHRIMAYTFYGYKPGYDVHHLDENPLNNSLSNLVYLTHAEHLRLHYKGKPKSDETRTKISAAKKGKKLGPPSEETRAKLSAATKGKRWWHRSSGEEKMSKECPGEGWYLGRNK